MGVRSARYCGLLLYRLIMNQLTQNDATGKPSVGALYAFTSCLWLGALRAVTVKGKYCFILAVGGAREEKAADGCCMYCLLPLGARETLPDQLVARVRRTPAVSINNYRLATCKPTHAVLCTSSGCAREAIKLFKRFQFH